MGIITKNNPMGGNNKKSVKAINLKVTVDQSYSITFTFNGTNYSVSSSSPLNISILSNTAYSVSIQTGTRCINSISITSSNGVQSVTGYSMYSATFTIPASSSDVTVSISIASMGCVMYDTPILLSDGTFKEAQYINIGDEVVSYDIDNDIFVINTITSVATSFKEDIVKITFEDNKSIEITSGHAVLTNDGWASVNPDKTIKENIENPPLLKLKTGDLLKIYDDKYIAIKSIEHEELGEVAVYDFTVNGIHNFIGGESKIVLHNVTTGSAAPL